MLDTVRYDRYLRNHPNCVFDTTCSDSFTACGEACPVPTAADSSRADVAAASTPPVIDGAVDANGVWDTSTTYSLDRSILGPVVGTNDRGATFKALWDSSALYVLVTVTDDARKNDSPHPWDDDSVEIYLDGDNSKAASYTADDFQFVFGWNDTSVVEAHGKSTAGVSFATQDTASGYRMEIRIPWSSIDALSGISWRTVGLDVQVNDDDNGGGREGKISWNAEVDSAWTDPRVFGSALLVAGHLPTCPPLDADNPFGIYRARVTPVIDGVEDASGAYGWSSIGYLTTFSIVGTVSSRSDLSGDWKLIWDSTYLYLLATVKDDVKRNDSLLPWDDDSVELYIDGDDSKATAYTPDDFQFVFGWNDTTVVEAHGKSTAGISFAKIDLIDGYQIEARIPWTTINDTPPTVGHRIGLDVHVNDDDDGGARDGKLAWSALVDDSWTNPGRFGNGELSQCTNE